MIGKISFGVNRRKYVSPVLSAEDFKSLRNSVENINNVRLAREGDKTAKQRLVQICYNSIHPTEQLAGESFYNEYFAFDYDDLATREDFIGKVLAERENLGLVMLERSVSKGAHAIFLRKKGETILEGLMRISNSTGFPFDENCIDLNRVIYATTASEDDLLYLDDRLFSPCPDMEEAKRETEELLPREMEMREEWHRQRMAKAEQEESQEPSESSLADVTEGTLSEQQREIIEGTFRICGYEPSEITEGMRENAVFSVAMKLRHWVGFKVEKIMPLLYPHYSFGLDEWEVRKAINDALKEERGYAPKALMSLIQRVEGGNASPLPRDGLENDPIAMAYQPFSEAVAEEVLMPNVPLPMKILLKSAPYGYKYPVMAAICPAACTLLTDVRMKYGTKKPKRMNAWTHVDGQFSSNKGLIIQPIETILYELQQQDNENQEKMNEVLERNRLNRNKETLEKVPQLPVRIIEAGTTRKQHIIMMKNAEGRHTFTLCDELDSLKSRGSGYYDRADFERLMFDNGKVCSRTAVDDTPNVSTKVAWNLATSSTRDQTIHHWRSVTDGSISRVWFVIMPDNTYAPKPTYYQFSDEEKAYISQISLVMMKMKGSLSTPKLDKAMDAWDTQERMACEEAGNRVRAQLKNRAQEIAHTFGGVLFCMEIAQKIVDRENQGFDSEEERLEWESNAYNLAQYKENPQTIKMAIYCANKILDAQESLWGKQILNQTISACAQQKTVRMPNNDITRLPDGEFTIADIEPLFPGRKPDSLRVMLSRYYKTHLLYKVGVRDKKTVYRKVS